MNKINKNSIASLIIVLTVFCAVLLGLSPATTSAQYYQYPQYQYTVITNNALNITSNSATFQGSVSGQNQYTGYNLETWFQYGTTTNLEFSTVHNYSNSGYANFSSNVVNLVPNTVYYFRAVAQSPQGLVYGGTNSFRTNFGTTGNYYDNNYYNNTSQSVITEPATFVKTTSVQLNAFIQGLNGNYSYTYFEWGEDMSLRNKTTIIGTGVANSVKHTDVLTRLSPNTTYYFRAVLENTSSGKIAGTILSFTTNNVAYVAPAPVQTITITPSQPTNIIQPMDSYLGASVLSSGLYLPGNLLSWLLVIILILAIILIAKHLFSTPAVVVDHGHSSH